MADPEAIPRLRKFTTEYVERQDRIRMTGEIAPQKVVTAWFTQRLLNRMVPPLLRWLGQQVPEAWRADAGAVQGFRQQAARASLEQVAPVRGGPGAWLVVEVEVTTAPKAVRLRLKGSEPELQQVVLPMTGDQLRQWLGILHDQYRRAQWPMALWPEWMTPEGGPASSEQRKALH